jgi:hypothetical protein
MRQFLRQDVRWYPAGRTIIIEEHFQQFNDGVVVTAQIIFQRQANGAPIEIGRWSAF